MELQLREPHSQVVRGANGLNIPDGTAPIFVVSVGESPHIYMWLDLVLINHRTTRREVILNCELHLKKRHWLLWRKTVTSAAVLLDEGGSGSSTRAWRPITLEPISLPVTITVEAQRPITHPVVSLPRKMWLVLEFDMVGPTRHMRRVVQEVVNVPQLSSSGV